MTMRFIVRGRKTKILMKMRRRMRRFTARGRETKRERKVQAVKVIAVTVSTNA